MFSEIIDTIDNYMTENSYSSIEDFKGLASEYIKENERIDFPDC